MIWIIIAILNFHHAHAIVSGETLSERDLDQTGTVALIFKKENGELFRGCTGIRITSKLILTAIHCVDGRAPLGITNKIQKPIIDIQEIESYVVFPNSHFVSYVPNQNNDYYYDLAVIKLKKDYNGTILPIDFSEISIGSNNLLQMGFGQNSHTEFSYWPIPAKLNNGVVSDGAKQINNLMVKNTNSSTQSGDSGGPLIMYQNDGPKIIGILTKGMSRNIDPSNPYYRSLYEKLSFYETWLKNIISDADQAHP